jgi:hypothetical protein
MFSRCQSGVSYYRSEVSISMIADGTASTYMLGEKFLQAAAYEGARAAGTPGFDWGDNNSMYVGFEWDNHRVSFEPRNVPYPGGTTQSQFPGSGLGGANDDLNAEYYHPRKDLLNYPNGYGAFGSAHSSGVEMAMCDGSVQTISYDIEPFMHRKLANRIDGEITDLD